MELAEEFEGLRGMRSEAPLPFGIQRSAPHHAGLTAEILGWHPQAERLGELPRGPSNQNDAGQHLT